MFAAELVVDVGLDDFVDAAVGGEAEALGAGGVEAVGPAGDDLLDVGIGLPFDAAYWARQAQGAIDGAGSSACQA